MNSLNEIYNLIDEKDYITDPIDFIYSEEYELSKENIMDVLNYIVKHNKEKLNIIKRKNEELQKKMDFSSNEIIKEEPTSSKISYIKREYKDVDSRVDLLFFSFYENDFNTIIESIPTHEIPFIKLTILKRINELKTKIKELIYSNNVENIIQLKKDIEIYMNIINYLSITNEVEKTEEIEDTYDSRILLPTINNTSYIYNDLLTCIEENKEIVNGFNKVISGYFLTTKDLRDIKKYDKLYEYKNPNGLRVMYVVLPNNYILICKVFIKDKNKSTKIESIYEEAYQRYLLIKDEIMSNLTNPDFMINQSLLVGEIVTLFESIDKNKKVGE